MPLEIWARRFNIFTVAIIQARMGSTRLPGKVLKDIVGDTMLGRVVSRTKRAKLLNKVVVATSDKVMDDAVVEEAKRLGVEFFRGSENDVLDRYYQTALSFKAETVVRVTSDCPLIDAAIIDKVISAFSNSKCDYASNTLVRTYPRGLDVEVLSLATLKKVWQEASKPYQRVHVTPYIYENPALFRLHSVSESNDYSSYRWTVDTPEDLEFVRAIYDRLGSKSNFNWLDVLSLCEKEPSLTNMNRKIEQKKLENA